MCVIARQAKERGARLVLISKNNTAPLAREADAVLQIPTQLCTQKLQTKGSEFEQSLFILCDNIGVELMLRLGCIRQIRDIDPFIRVLRKSAVIGDPFAQIPASAVGNILIDEVILCFMKS